MEGKQEIFTDRFLAEFERSFAEQYPMELTAHYDLLECLSDKDGEETLLAVAKTGEKVVIKYFEGRRETSSEQVFAQLKNLEYEGIPCFLAYVFCAGIHRGTSADGLCQETYSGRGRNCTDWNRSLQNSKLYSWTGDAHYPS